MALSRKLNKKHDFNPAGIGEAPQHGGVYVLYQDAEIVFIGRAQESIRKELEARYRGDETGLAQRCTHYAFEKPRNPEKREEQLLEWHKTAYLRLPRHNERYG